MREQHERVGLLGDDAGGEVENREKGEGGGGEVAFPARPELRGKTPSHAAAGDDKGGIGQAKGEAGAGVEQEIEKEIERRLVVPEVAIGELAVEDLDGGGEVIIFVGPKDVEVSEARSEDGSGEDGPEEDRDRAAHLVKITPERSSLKIRTSRGVGRRIWRGRRR